VADRRPEPVGAQSGAQRLAAPVLPHDGVVDGLAGAAVPHHGGLALVGDADGADVAAGQAGRRQRLARGGELRVPDLARVVLDPTGLGVDLAEFALRHRHDPPGGVEDDAAGTRGPLVQGEQIGHGAASNPTRLRRRPGVAADVLTC